MIENLILSIFKFLAGIYGHSHAMLSDSIHSMSDVISTVIVMIGVHFSSMKEDNEHPYGHERMECIAAMILSVLLVFTGLQIGYNSLLSLFDGPLLWSYFADKRNTFYHDSGGRIFGKNTL